jgi:hypothetical protein
MSFRSSTGSLGGSQEDAAVASICVGALSLRPEGLIVPVLIDESLLEVDIIECLEWGVCNVQGHFVTLGREEG